uniref:Molybdate-anion transporter n=1 Tax=Alexandrium monilatum TaxID=311494 RepID=A0A7S4Q6T8_9DINO
MGPRTSLALGGRAKGRPAMARDVVGADCTGSGGAVVPEKRSSEYARFRRSYLMAFLCAASSDWLKGPYIYRFYEARGFQPQEITVLFAAGYLSSAFFGVVAGVLTDALGRRRMCLCFCALYTLHCALHAAEGFWLLLLARAVSGVATALLFSAFEAWLVAEHGRQFPERANELAGVFATQTQGNALAAVASGVAAQLAVLAMGYAGPFAVATPLLALCAREVRKWPENAGNGQRDPREVLRAALAGMNSVVARVGLLQCLFEGSMHVFVFLWTPCLQRSGHSVPHGLVFSLYMLCMMAGGRQCAGRFRPPLGWVFAVAAACLIAPRVSEGLWGNLAAFCCFEWCVGCYFPQIAVLRSRHLSNESRGATITLFRVPFNCIVVAVLVYGRALPPQAMLSFASGALACGALACWSLPKEASVGGSGPDAAKAD